MFQTWARFVRSFSSFIPQDSISSYFVKGSLPVILKSHPKFLYLLWCSIDTKFFFLDIHISCYRKINIQTFNIMYPKPASEFDLLLVHFPQCWGLLENCYKSHPCQQWWIQKENRFLWFFLRALILSPQIYSRKEAELGNTFIIP